jgi:hypothetical protein
MGFMVDIRYIEVVNGFINQLSTGGLHLVEAM